MVIYAFYKLPKPRHLQSSVRSFQPVRCQMMHPLVLLTSHPSDQSTHMISISFQFTPATTTAHISTATLATESSPSSTPPHTFHASQHTSQHPLPMCFVSGCSSDQPRQSSPPSPADRVNAERRSPFQRSELARQPLVTSLDTSTEKKMVFESSFLSISAAAGSVWIKQQETKSIPRAVLHNRGNHGPRRRRLLSSRLRD